MFLRSIASSVLGMTNSMPNVRFFKDTSGRFLATIQASESLKARARTIRDELTDTLATALARSMNQALPDTR